MTSYLLEQPKPRTRTYALLVGVEQYDFPVTMDLPGCRAACERFRDWLVKNGVERDHIFLHISPSQEGIASAEFVSLGKQVNQLAEIEADLVFVYWAGHGYLMDGRRNVFLADSNANGFGYDVDALIARIVRKNKIKQIVGIFDCCANPVAELFRLASAGTQSLQRNVETYILFACGLGQVAHYDRAKGGEFSDELFSELEKQTWPLDCVKLDLALRDRFLESKTERSAAGQLSFGDAAAATFRMGIPS